MFSKSLILRLCSQPRTFEFISKNLSGLDPLEAFSLLEELKTSNQISEVDGLWVVSTVPVPETVPLFKNDSENYLEKYMGYYSFLKTPHPLDYEWRNSTLSLNKLIQRLLSYTFPSDNILFLGMPTLFATAIEKDIPNKITLIERNKPILNGLQSKITDPSRFKIVDADIFKIEPTMINQHFCVMMDPPWYTPHFFQFMWLAASCIPVGGIVAISLPPINTRPNIISERIEWFTFCKDLGLCIEVIDPHQLQYAMPFFEFNAFRAAGVSSILPFWRKGDFTVFRKTQEVSIPRPPLESNENVWVEKAYKSMRVRIKKGEKNCGTNIPLDVKSIVKGDILPSVSSRNKIRDLANVWTSGNRIFEVNNPDLLINVIDAILRDQIVSEDEKYVSNLLNMIEELEVKEFKEYVEWVYYEMERQTD